MSFYQVNSRNLRSGRDELLSLNERLKAERETLNTCELGLKEMWEGEANERFHLSFVKNSSQIEAFSTLITRYCEVMEVIADRYDSAEQKNISLAQGSNY